jgi:hypothetical protein
VSGSRAAELFAGPVGNMRVEQKQTLSTPESCREGLIVRSQERYRGLSNYPHCTALGGIIHLGAYTLRYAIRDRSGFCRNFRSSPCRPPFRTMIRSLRRVRLRIPVAS